MHVYIYIYTFFGWSVSLRFEQMHRVSDTSELSNPLWLNPWPAPNATKLTETHGTHSNPQGPKAIPQAWSAMVSLQPSNFEEKRSDTDLLPVIFLSGCLVMVTLQVSRRPVSTALDFLKPIRVATHLQFVTLRPYTR